MSETTGEVTDHSVECEASEAMGEVAEVSEVSKAT